jgi:DNA polymerase-3 subunit delta
VAAGEIVLFYGEESFLVDEGARATLARWRRDLVSEFGYEALDPAAVTAARLREAILQLPFLDPYRVVAVRDLPPRRSDLVVPALDEVPETTRLLLTVHGKLPPTSRLVQAVREAGGRAEERRQLKGRELQTWVAARTKEYGLPPVVAAVLLRLARPDLAVIDSELAKLAAYQAGGNRLDRNALEELIVAGRQDEIYRLTDHILPRPDAEAWRLVREFIERGENPTAVAYRLARHLALVLEVRARLDREERLADVQVSLREHPFVVQKAYEAAATTSEQRLEAGLRALLDYEWEVKSGQIDAALGLEAVLARL